MEPLQRTQPAKVAPTLRRASAIVLAVALACSASCASRRHDVPFEFEGGASSVEQLADRLLMALEANDESALHELRVTKDEYNRIVVPGTVEPGQPPRQSSDHAKTVFWNLLNQRSEDFARAMLAQFGGQPLQRTGPVQFAGTPHRYAWYDALGQLRIPVNATTADAEMVRTGWAIGVNGRYKLIGLAWDD